MSKRLSIVGLALLPWYLQLSDATGTRLAVFASRVQGQPTMAGLTGTSWQLVKFQGSDGATLTPDDRSKYTIEFTDGGR
jgi:hypothetical protein